MKKKYCISVCILVFLFSLSLWAQEPYKKPNQEVIDIVEAPPPPQVSLSPDRTVMLLSNYETMPSIAYMSQPLLRIA